MTSNAAIEKIANPRAKFVHCLPALHDKNTVVGGEIIEETGMDDWLENRLQTIKAVLVATLGSG